MLSSVAVIVFCILKREGERKWLLFQIMISLIPVLVLFLFYIINVNSSMNESAIWSYNLLEKSKQYFRALSTFFQYNYQASVTEAILLFIINLSIIVSLVLFLIYLSKDILEKLLYNRFTVVGIGFILGAFLSPFYVGGFGYAGNRFFWLGVVFIAAAILSITNRATKIITNVVVVLVVIITGAKVLLLIDQGIKDWKIEEEISAIIPQDEPFLPIMVTYDYLQYIAPNTRSRKVINRICPVINSFNRIPYYILSDRNQIYQGIFKTGMIRAKSLDCDPVSLIEGNTMGYGHNCSRLLLISPVGFSSDLGTKLRRNYNIIKYTDDYIFAINKESN